MQSVHKMWKTDFSSHQQATSCSIFGKKTKKEKVNNGMQAASKQLSMREETSQDWLFDEQDKNEMMDKYGRNTSPRDLVHKLYEDEDRPTNILKLKAFLRFCSFSTGPHTRITSQTVLLHHTLDDIAGIVESCGYSKCGQFDFSRSSGYYAHHLQIFKVTNSNDKWICIHLKLQKDSDGNDDDDNETFINICVSGDKDPSSVFYYFTLDQDKHTNISENKIRNMIFPNGKPES